MQEQMPLANQERFGIWKLPFSKTVPSNKAANVIYNDAVWRAGHQVEAARVLLNMLCSCQVPAATLQSAPLIITAAGLINLVHHSYRPSW